MIVSPLILIGIITAALLMICFGYLSKSSERHAQTKTRKIVKLKERARKLDNIIFGLPANYLPKTLKVLIYASIVDSLRQIHSLSGNDNISSQIERVRQTLSSLIDLDPNHHADQANDSMAELKESKYLLKDLYSLIIEFHSEGALDKNTTQKQLHTVRTLMLKVTLDTYKAAAIAAVNENNLGLALHYSGMALNRIQQDPSIKGLESEQAYFSNQVAGLEQRMKSTTNNTPGSTEQTPEAAVLAQWQALESADDEWKKKRY